MGKHHIQGETGLPSDCLPLAWNNIFALKEYLPYKLDSEMLISECKSMDFVKTGVLKISEMYQGDGNFDISVLHSTLYLVN